MTILNSANLCAIKKEENLTYYNSMINCTYRQIGGRWNLQILNELKQFVLKIVQPGITCFTCLWAGARIITRTSRTFLVISVDCEGWRSCRCWQNSLHHIVSGIGHEKPRQDCRGVADVRREPSVKLKSVVQWWNSTSAAVATLLAVSAVISTTYRGHLNPEQHCCALHSMQHSLTTMCGKNVRYTPEAFSVLRSWGPRPQHLSLWALGTCAPILPPPTRSLTRKVWVADQPSA